MKETIKYTATDLEQLKCLEKKAKHWISVVDLHWPHLDFSENLITSLKNLYNSLASTGECLSAKDNFDLEINQALMEAYADRIDSFFCVLEKNIEGEFYREDIVNFFGQALDEKELYY